MLKEMLEFLAPKPGQNFVDCTFGGGGYAKEILKRIGPSGKLLALDLSPEAVKVAREIKDKNFIFINDNFLYLSAIIRQYFPYPLHGFVFDLGLSSDELEMSGRGFSFQKNEPLDMRFDPKTELTAADILNHGSLAELNNIFKNYGECQFARRLAEEILINRKHSKFNTTTDLVAVVNKIHPRRYFERLHPATKVFQALRIAVNHELENFSEALKQTENILAPGGRVVTVCFHALEDRIAKNYFRSGSRGADKKWLLLTKKPLTPELSEVALNPRSRSAKLRAVEKI